MKSPRFTRQKSKIKWESGYFTIPNKLVQDKELTDSAFRLLAWMESCSNDWIIYQTDIMKRFQWGRDKLKAAMDNLINLKYLVNMGQSVLEDGKFGHCDYEFAVQGFTDEEIREIKIMLPMSGFPTSVDPTSADPTSNNIRIRTTPNPKTVCIAGATSSDISEKKPEPREPQKVRSITKQNYRGDDITIGWDELITHATVTKKDWRLTEMQESWQILQDRQGYVNDLMEFIAGTISNLRNKTRAGYANKGKGKCKSQTTTSEKNETRSSLDTSSSSKSNSAESGTKVTLLDLLKAQGVDSSTKLPPG